MTTMPHVRTRKARWVHVQGLHDNWVRSVLGDAELLTIGGEKAASWKWQTTRRVDVKALGADHPELVEQYRNETRSRVLRYTKEKQ